MIGTFTSGEPRRLNDQTQFYAMLTEFARIEPDRTNAGQPNI